MQKIIKVIQSRVIPGQKKKIGKENGPSISETYLAQLAEDETPIFV